MTQDRYDEILFRTIDDANWWAFKLTQPMEMVDLTRFQGRVIFGQPNKTSNQLLSTWVISDLMGGHGIDRLRIGTDQNRYRFATLYARIPGQLALPRFAASEAGPNTDGCRPLGDLLESGTYRFYAAFGTALSKWDESGGAFGSSAATLGGTPVNKAVEFKGSGTRKLFIPLGANGYDTWDGSTHDTSHATPLAQAFCLWDDKLIALDTDGQLHYTTDGSTWTSYGTSGKLDASYVPRHLAVYYDRQDNPCIHVVTNRGVWAFDPAGPRLYLTETRFPHAPNQALGADVWRGSLYVSNGMGVTQYTGNVVNPGVGLDRDDGLPDAYRLYIKDLQAEFNGLYALAVGSASSTNNYVSVHVWTGFGWHCEYASAARSALAKITWLQVSQAQGGYRLWWGEDGAARSIKLPTDFANPRALTSAGTGEFDADGTFAFESGRFDADMENYQKVANTIEGRVAADIPDAFTLSYRRNGETAYTTVATIADVTLPGPFSLPLGLDLEGGSGTAGVTFNDIEIKLEMEGSDNASAGVSATSPLVEYLALTYRQMVPGSASWTAMLDLRGPHKGKSPDQMRAKLDELLNYAGFFEMMHQGTVYRVCFSQLAGRDESGNDTRNHRQLNILEVPQTGILAGLDATVAIPNFVAAMDTSGTGTSVVVTKDALVEDDQLLVASVAYDDAATAVTPPAGWTLARSSEHSAGGITLATYYRVAAAEGASWTWTLGSSEVYRAVVLAFANMATSSPFVAASENGETNVEAPVAATLTTATANALLVAVSATADDLTYTVPTDMVSRYSAATDPCMMAASRVQAAAGASGHKTFAITGDDTADPITQLLVFKAAGT